MVAGLPGVAAATSFASKHCSKLICQDLHNISVGVDEGKDEQCVQLMHEGGNGDVQLVPEGDSGDERSPTNSEGFRYRVRVCAAHVVIRSASSAAGHGRRPPTINGSVETIDIQN